MSMKDFCVLKEYFLSLNIPYNEHYLDRYLKFILSLPEITKKEGYGESHHILPKSLFPQFRLKKDAPWNQKRISARAHYICHWMLWKAFPENRDMMLSFWIMLSCKSRDRDYSVGSISYDILRTEFSEYMRSKDHTHLDNTVCVWKDNSWFRIPSDEYENNKDLYIHPTKGMVVARPVDGSSSYVLISKEVYYRGGYVTAQEGKKRTNETKEKMKEKWSHRISQGDYIHPRLGKIVSEETRKKISDSLKGKSYITEEGRNKISETHRGRKDSEETRKKKSDSAKKNHVSVRPWERKNKILKPSDKLFYVWILADKLKKIWKINGCPKHTAFCKYVGLSPSKHNNTFQCLIGAFFSGWEPTSDDSWNKWKNTHEDLEISVLMEMDHVF